MNIRLILGVLLAGAVQFCRAADYTWPNAVSGNWSEPANWSPNTGYPNTGDKVTSLKYGGPYTLTLTEDISLAGFSTSDAGGGQKVIDLNGRTLTVAGGANGLMSNCGDVPKAPGSDTYATGVLFKDGTLTCVGMCLGNMGAGSSGRAVFDFDNATLNGYCNSWSGPSRVILRNGSTWNVTNETRIEPGLWHATKDTRYPCLIVDASTVSSADYNLIIGSLDGWLYLRNGAEATFRDVNVGGTFRSTNCVACVDNSTLTAEGTLRVGTDNINPTEGGTGTIKCDFAMGRSSTLVVLGASASVTAGAMEIYDGTDSGIELTVPGTGWTAPPVTAGSLTTVPRDGKYEDFGPIRFTVNCYAWAKEHPDETQTLMAFDTDSRTTLEALAACVVWGDYPSSLVEQGKTPTLAVSADGRSLVLTAPAVNHKPDFEVSVSAGASVGAKTIGLAVGDYGYGATSITEIDLTYADNAEFVGATTVNVLEGTDPVSAVLPCELAYQLNGGFRQHEVYWLKVKAVNELGYFDEVVTTLAGDGVAEVLVWADATAGGDFEDAAKWTNYTTQQPAGTHPHAEDTVRWGWKNCFYDVALNEDAAVHHFETFTAENPKLNQLTFEMNGNRLDFFDDRNGTVAALELNAWSAEQDDFEPCGATMRFRNGTVYVPASLKNGSAPGLSFGSIGNYNNSGTLILENGADFTANVKYFSNASRLFIRSGSAFHTANGAFQFCRHTVSRRHPRVIVSGEGSLFDMKTYELMVRNGDSQCLIQDGGKLIAGDLHVGYTNHLWGMSGTLNTVESTNTLVRFENGTGVLSGEIELGWYANLACNARLVLAGTNAAVTAAKDLRIHENLASSVEFEVPSAGYQKCPLTVKDLVFIPKPAANDDFGPTALKIAMKSWMKAHPTESADLLTLTTSNAAALERLKNAAVFTDVTVGRYPDHEFLSVSDDGTRLVLTAPPKKGLMLIFR